MYVCKKFFVLACTCLTFVFMLQVPVFPEGNLAEGKKVFGIVCSSCHGDSGMPDLPGIPVFAEGERMEKTDDVLKKSIRNGVENPNNPAGQVMPPFGGGDPLTDKQVEDVLSYIRTLKK